MTERDERHDSGDHHGTAYVDGGSRVVEGESDCPWVQDTRVVEVEEEKVEQLHEQKGRSDGSTLKERFLYRTAHAMIWLQFGAMFALAGSILLGIWSVVNGNPNWNHGVIAIGNLIAAIALDRIRERISEEWWFDRV